MRLTIAGGPINRFALPGVAPVPLNKGKHRIHLGGSYLLVPHVS